MTKKHYIYSVFRAFSNIKVWQFTRRNLLFFMFFQNPFPESILGGWSSQVTLKNAILEQVLLPAGSKMSPLGSHFRPKGVKKVTTPNSTTPPGADLVAIWRRERPIKHFGTILDAILVTQWARHVTLGAPFSAIGEVLRTIFCVLGPTWARPVTQNHPRTHLQRFDVDFGLIWDRNLSDFEYIWVAKGIFVMFFSWIFKALSDYIQPLGIRQLCISLRASRQLDHLANLAT